MGTRGVVLGGGVAGFLAAAALAGAVDEVVVVERDRFDDSGAPRGGVPQARHAHLLLARGARAIDELVPGTVEALLARNAHRVGMPGDLMTFTPFGWLPRVDHTQFLISCRRGLLEAVLRARVLRDRRITVRPGTEAVGLAGGPAGITAVLVRERGSRQLGRIDGDLVADATGAGSAADRWLSELGVPSVREKVVDGGIRYATRTYRPPAELAGAFPAVCVQPDPAGAGHGGVLLPTEDGDWIVSLAGMRGHVPPTDEPGFAAFAAGLRHRLIADLIATAAPRDPIRGFAAPPDRLRRFPRLPEGFVALGDAVCVLNPLYGHGMTVAAVHALALRDEVRRRGLGAGLGRAVERAIGRATADAWALSVGQDTRYPATIGPPAGRSGAVRAWYADRVGSAAAARSEVATALLDAYTLTTPLSGLLRPGTVLKVLATRRGRRTKDEPPISAREAALLREAGATTGGER